MSDPNDVLMIAENEPRLVVRRVTAGEVVLYSARSPEKTTDNEDAAGLLSHGDACVLAVADGLGGERSGQQASAAAMTAVQATLQDDDRWAGEQRRTAILDGIEAANQSVRQLNLGAATTLAVVEVAPDFVRPYHVGDSTIMVVGQRGKVKLQTVAHSPVGLAQEAGFLDEKEAMAHDERHIVSNVVGDADMRIEMGSPIRLARRDTLLLASDGLVDNLYLDEIVQFICQGPLADGVRAMVILATRRMQTPDQGTPCKPDDLTVVALRPAKAQEPVAGG